MDKQNDENQNNIVSEEWTNTEMKVTTVSYTWKISNFSFQFGGNIYIFSTEFSSGDEVKWRLAIKTDLKKDWLDVELHLVSADRYPIKAKCKCKWDGLTYTLKEFPYVFEKSGGIRLAHIVSFCDNRYLILKNDELTIHCEVRYISNIIHVSNNSVNDKFSPLELKDNLKDDMETLLLSEAHSDVTIIVGSELIKAHKIILSARSPVFSAMFSHSEMEENTQNEVIITDIDADMFRELLRFLYTGKCRDLKDNALELMAAADKYQVGHLKTLCAQSLYFNLSFENVAECLIYADTHSAAELKKRAIKFISRNLSQVNKTEGWRSLIKSHPHLVSETLDSLTA